MLKNRNNNSATMSSTTIFEGNFPLLQNRIKRDPQSYKDDFMLVYSSYESQREIFMISPPSSKQARAFGRLLTFVSHVSHLYASEEPRVSVFAENLMELLDKHHEVMENELRKTIVQALILLRNRGQIEPVTLLSLCFRLFRCKDKPLRAMLFAYIVNDVRSINRKNDNNKLNRRIQHVVYEMISDGSKSASKHSLRVVVELYRRRVWIDTRTVNVIAEACFSKITKNVVVAIEFFLGIDRQIDADIAEQKALAQREIEQMGATSASIGSFSKKTRARLRKKEKIEKKGKKAPKILLNAETRRIEAPRFPAIDMINDPQGFAERLFKRLKSSSEHFEVRMLMMNIISRVIGFHKLFMLPFYSFMQRYVQPHQRHVTNILAFLIQASHDLVPPEELAPLVRAIANNFITDRSGPEVMAVGLNSIRELMARVPLISDSQGVDDLISDLIAYRKYRRDKSVVMAARSLLNAVREINPMILERKERGKFHDKEAKPRAYGEHLVHDGVDGAELLKEGVDKERILSEEDILKIRQLKRQMEAEKRDPRKKKRKVGEMNGEGEGSESEEEEIMDTGFITDSDDEGNVNDGSVLPSQLEGAVKRRKRELLDRLKSVYEGREGAHEIEKRRTGGTSNREKEKRTKNYLMVSKSRKVRAKAHQSLRQQQLALKKHIKHLEKNKKLVQKVRRRGKKR